MLQGGVVVNGFLSFRKGSTQHSHLCCHMERQKQQVRLDQILNLGPCFSLPSLHNDHKFPLCLSYSVHSVQGC